LENNGKFFTRRLGETMSQTDNIINADPQSNGETQVGATAATAATATAATATATAATATKTAAAAEATTTTTINDYNKVFSPLVIKGIEFQNRIICTPHVWGWGSREGTVSQEQAACYERIAQGRPALVTLGNCAIDMDECCDELNQINLGNDKSIFGLGVLRRRVERFGTHLSAQINYCGRNAWWQGPGFKQPKMYAPSPITSPGHLERADLAGIHPEPVHELSKEKIYELEELFANAAGRLKQAGFKVIMLHFAHNNLVGQFFSPLSNFRNDEYGPMSLETRTRFAREVLQAVRKRVGDEMIIDLRFSGEDVMPGGLQQKEAIAIAQILEPWTDIFTISCAFHNKPSYIGPQTTLSYYSPQITLLDYTRPFRAALKNSKLVLTTSVVDLDNAKRVLEEDVADFVGMAGPFLADPDIIRKYAQGKRQDVRPCIRCEAHWNFVPEWRPVFCTVNPLCGRALEFPSDKLPPAEQPKRVLVVGAGPAGMQAALTAAERGHEVILAEKQNHIGGNLIKAANIKVKAEFKKYIDWLIPRVEEAATVMLDTDVDAAFVKTVNPDVMILAAGASDIVPPIPGCDRRHVYFAWQADDGSVEVGDNVVVIGGGLVGVESAMQLAEDKNAANRKVTIIEAQDERTVTDARGSVGSPAVKRAEDAGVQIKYLTSVVAINEDSVTLKDNQSLAITEIAADTVLLACGIRPRRELVDELRNLIAPTDVYIVGDLRGDGGNIGHATATAFDVAVVI
jgi:2,4-dienoyl-CoA reductase-like NADH-dependent reductase (Old Yellow Enzyme family)/thioredoxin reductase